MYEERSSFATKYNAVKTMELWRFYKTTSLCFLSLFAGDAQKLGYKLLVYVRYNTHTACVCFPTASGVRILVNLCVFRCCASGLGYPSGKLPAEEQQLAKASVNYLPTSLPSC